MKFIPYFLMAAVLLTGADLLAQKDRPLVAIESVSNKSENRSLRMESFPAAVMDRIVNSRRFDVCRTMTALRTEIAKRTGVKENQGAFLIRVTVLQYSTLNKKITRDNRMYLYHGAKVVAQLEYTDARTGKVLESKRAQFQVYEDDLSSGDTVRVVHTLSLKVAEEAMQALATICADRFLEMVYPIKILRVSGNALYINAGQDRVAAGECLNVYKLGESFIDPDTGENLGADEEYVAQVRVSQAKQKYSIATVVNGAVTGDRGQYILRKCSTEQIAAPAASEPAAAPAETNPHGANPF